MVKRLARSVVVVGSLALATVLPATAQSRWDTEGPIFFGFAQGGFLITLAPPTFDGCTQGFAGVAQTDLPNLELFSWSVVLDPGAPLFPLRIVVNPLGTYNFTWTNDVWIRVFPASRVDLGAFIADPCGFYGAHPFVAEGVGRSNFHSVDDAMTGPGVSAWGWTVLGDLNDHGYCPAGQNPSLSWIAKWVIRSQTDAWTAKSTSSKGPTLTCK